MLGGGVRGGDIFRVRVVPGKSSSTELLNCLYVAAALKDREARQAIMGRIFCDSKGESQEKFFIIIKKHTHIANFNLAKDLNTPPTTDSRPLIEKYKISYKS